IIFFVSLSIAGHFPREPGNVTIINVHQGLSPQVMEEAYSYDQGYTPWNSPPYQHHSPRYNAYQSNRYEDPSPPYYPPSQTGIEEALQLL
ncbi:hypothetical protein PIB30_105134, partial [Stylosanthes scabra]|nr:hypothetical protein [Stylosanthes scabra]